MVGSIEDGATLRLPKIEANENELIKHVIGIIIDKLWNVDLLDLQTPSYSGLEMQLAFHSFMNFPFAIVLIMPVSRQAS